MTFQEKLNQQIASATAAWWKSLTKEELIEFLSSQEQITADYLRTMLSNEGIVLNFGTAFNCNESKSEISI